MCSVLDSACSFVSIFFFIKQKTAKEMRISDWSSDVCSSDLQPSVVKALEAAGFRGAVVQRFDSRNFAIRPAPEENAKAQAEAPDVKRSEERRVGTECVRPCRYRWSPYH